jgi:4-amino-4-deoxy-L-arabinose transferase-like glycosyltransferase
LLAAAFILAVLQIQQSHFFTVDTVANLFIFLSLLFAAEITRRGPPAAVPQEAASASAGFDDDEVRLAALYAEDSWRGRLEILWSGMKDLARDPLAVTLGFGVSLGLAMASKLNAAPLAIVLPAAFAARYLMFDRDRLDANDAPVITAYWSRLLIYFVIGGLFTMITFRFAQPYAFDGLGLNPAWLANIRDLQAQ